MHKTKKSAFCSVAYAGLQAFDQVLQMDTRLLHDLIRKGK